MSGWRVWADRWEVVHTSSALNDVMAREECRAFAAGRYPEPGRAVAERETPGRAGRWVVKVRLPAIIGECGTKKEATALSGSHEGAVVVREGSGEEGVLMSRRRQLLRPE